MREFLMAERSILITGGAGFIGSRLVAALLRADPRSRIYVLDILHPQVHGPNSADPDFPAQVEFIRGDVVDAALMREVVARARPELVYHLAAETGTGQSYDEPTRYCQVNILGTTNLVEALRGVDSARRVVLAASRAVYGEGGYRDAAGREFVGLPRQPQLMGAGDFSVPLPAAACSPGTPVPSHAGLPPAPASIYASSKLMQEYVLSQAGEGAPWQATMLRFQNFYGPGQSLRNPYTGVLSIFARQWLGGGRLAIFEDGQIARDFVFVDDVVSALVLAGERDVAHGSVIDIGSGEAVTILDAARTLMRALGCRDDAFEITGQFRIGDIRHACADIRAARDLLGWLPSVSVETGLQQLAHWARNEYQSGNL
jgi:dTDP-L-rhamnose 4-epimerase